MNHPSMGGAGANAFGAHAHAAAPRSVSNGSSSQGSSTPSSMWTPDESLLARTILINGLSPEGELRTMSSESKVGCADTSCPQQPPSRRSACFSARWAASNRCSSRPRAKCPACLLAMLRSSMLLLMRPMLHSASMAASAGAQKCECNYMIGCHLNLAVCRQKLAVCYATGDSS